MSFGAFTQLVTTFIFISAREKSRVKWENSQKSTQNMRTIVTKSIALDLLNKFPENFTDHYFPFSMSVSLEKYLVYQAVTYQVG